MPIDPQEDSRLLRTDSPDASIDHSVELIITNEDLVQRLLRDLCSVLRPRFFSRETPKQGGTSTVHVALRVCSLPIATVVRVLEERLFTARPTEARVGHLFTVYDSAFDVRSTIPSSSFKMKVAHALAAS